MKFTAPAAQFKTALNKLANPPGETPTQLPSLAIVVIADGFDGVSLRRTNAVASLTTPAPDTAVEDDGCCAVDFARLVAAVGSFAGEALLFTLEADILKITAGKEWAKVACYPAAEIPEERALPDAETELVCEGNDLKAHIKAVLPAASVQDNEPQFRGICIREMRGQACIFALDKHRFHLRYLGDRKIPIDPEGATKGIMLPTETAQAILRLLDEGGGRAQFGFTKGALRFEYAGSTAILPVTEATPPDVVPFVPWETPADITATCDREKLLRAARSSSVLGYGDSRVLSFTFADAAIELEGDTEKNASGGREVEAEIEGLPGKMVRAKGGNMADWLEAAGTAQVKVELVAARQMLVIRDETQMLTLQLIRDHKVNAGT